jgi:hypothetical protein
MALGRKGLLVDFFARKRENRHIDMSPNNVSERGPNSAASSAEGKQLRVFQPPQVTNILDTLGAIENLAQRVSEQSREDTSSDLGGSGSSGSSTRSSGVSPRDQAIAAMPSLPVVKSRLEAHIRREIKDLHAQAKMSVRPGKAGSAYKVNEIYAKIRRLNSLLRDLFEASVEVIRRLFIRVFIDKQSIL